MHGVVDGFARAPPRAPIRLHAFSRLDSGLLGVASDREIVIDATAAGWGWDVSGRPGLRMSLLQVVRHELAHALGHDHDEEGLMAERLAPVLVGFPVASKSVLRISSKLPPRTAKPLTKRISKHGALPRRGPLRA